MESMVYAEHKSHKRSRSVSNKPLNLFAQVNRGLLSGGGTRVRRAFKKMHNRFRRHDMLWIRATPFIRSKHNAAEMTARIPCVIPAKAGIQGVILDSGQKHAGMTRSDHGHCILWSSAKLLLAALSLVATLVMPMAIFAQPKEWIISVSQFVLHPALDALLRGFKETLQSKGLKVKYNIHIANGNETTNVEIARRIESEHPDLVLAISTPSAQACLKSLPNTTILFSAVTDPVAAGLLAALNKPGPHITGMTDMSPVERHVALIQELQPSLKRIGVLYNANESNSLSLVRVLQEECRKRGIEVVSKTVEKKEGVAEAAASLVGQCDAVYIPTDNTVVSAVETVASICGKNHLPLYAADVESVPRGAIVSLAIDYYGMGRQTARMAERILQGESPSTMPVESLEDYRIHVNLKAAELMKVELPVSLLQSADVIYDSFPN
jgi:putative tryptophan/tyrosine transport system substrate-binding protein